MDWALFGHQFAGGVVIFISAALGAAVPFFVRKKSFDTVTLLLNSCAAGAFLSLAVLHLFEESSHLLRHAGLGIEFDHGFYNFSQVFVFLGYALILFIEHVLYIPGGSEVNIHHHHHHHHGHAACPKAQDGAVCADLLDNRSPSSPSHSEGSLESSSISDVMQDRNAIYVGQTIEAANHPAVIEERKAKKSFSGAALCVLLALSAHAIFEGMLVGLGTSAHQVWMITISITAHKCCEGFALACSLLDQNVKKKISILYIGILCSMSPLGIIIGAAVDSSNDAAAGVLNALATGTILYVANEMVFDVFGSHPPLHDATGKPKKRHSNLTKFLCFFAGVSVMFGFCLLKYSQAPPH